MNLHKVKSLKVYSRVTMAAALIFTSCAAYSAALSEDANAAPSFEKDKPAGQIYDVNLEDITRTSVVETRQQILTAERD